MCNIDFLICGYPRSGTGYITTVFDYFGYDVGHELIGKHGISCWTFAVENDNCLHGNPKKGKSHHKRIINLTRKDIKYKYMIHIVRNPKDVLRSMYNTVPRNQGCFKFILNYTNQNNCSSFIEEIMESIVQWNDMIEENSPDLVFNTESDISNIKRFLIEKKYPVNVKDKMLSNTYNTRENSYNSFDIDINNINQDVLKNFNNHCVKYGYEELKR